MKISWIQTWGISKQYKWEQNQNNANAFFLETNNFFFNKKIAITEITHLYVHVKPHVCVNKKHKTPAGAGLNHINTKNT